MYRRRFEPRPAALLACLLWGVPATAQTLPQVNDDWSPMVTWEAGPWGDFDQTYAAPIHAALLPTGDVLFIGGWVNEPQQGQENDPIPPGDAIFVMQPTPLGQPIPTSVSASRMSVTPTYPQDGTMACGGHTFTSDGRFFIAGGVRGFPPEVEEVYGFAAGGHELSWTYDPYGWKRIAAPMLGTGQSESQLAQYVDPNLRYYPTATTLPDARILVTGGSDVFAPTWALSPNVSLEIFDPWAETFTVEQPHASAMPEIYNRDYTHVYVQPTGDLLMMGEYGVPVFYGLGGSWGAGPARPNTVPNTSPNNGASTALLPLRLDQGEWDYGNGSVLVAGGEHHTVHQSRVDIYDPVLNTWLQPISLPAGRHHPSTVLLPDGRVLVVAGHGPNNAALGRALYIDPKNDFELGEGVSSYSEVRGYHTVTLLLPDGRVLVGGGNLDGDPGTERTDFRYYYPDYMFGPRPQLYGADPVLQYGTSFEVEVDHASSVTEAVLMGIGAMTHSVDMNARHVQVAVDSTYTMPGGNVRGVLTAPQGPDLAPPGYYMLFVLDAQSIPSEATIVRLE